MSEKGSVCIYPLRKSYVRMGKEENENPIPDVYKEQPGDIIRGKPWSAVTSSKEEVKEILRVNVGLVGFTVGLIKKKKLEEKKDE